MLPCWWLRSTPGSVPPSGGACRGSAGCARACSWTTSHSASIIERRCGGRRQVLQRDEVHHQPAAGFQRRGSGGSGFEFAPEPPMNTASGSGQVVEVLRRLAVEQRVVGSDARSAPRRWRARWRVAFVLLDRPDVAERREAAASRPTEPEPAPMSQTVASAECAAWRAATARASCLVISPSGRALDVFEVVEAEGRASPRAFCATATRRSGRGSAAGRRRPASAPETIARRAVRLDGRRPRADLVAGVTAISSARDARRRCSPAR